MSSDDCWSPKVFERLLWAAQSFKERGLIALAITFPTYTWFSEVDSIAARLGLSPSLRLIPFGSGYLSGDWSVLISTLAPLATSKESRKAVLGTLRNTCQKEALELSKRLKPAGFRLRTQSYPGGFDDFTPNLPSAVLALEITSTLSLGARLQKLGTVVPLRSPRLFMANGSLVDMDGYETTPTSFVAMSGSPSKMPPWETAECQGLLTLPNHWD